MLLCLALMGSNARSQCVGGWCPVAPRPSRPPVENATPAPANVVRIVHETGEGRSLGSGALVAHQGGAGYVLTCAHLFDDGPGRTSVESAAIGRLAAVVVARDRAHDLALLRTSETRATPFVVNHGSQGGVLTACGYGPTGRYACVRGPVVGQATPAGAGYPSLLLRGAVRQGDSGGPVLDAAGRLVGVVWGERSGATYFTTGEPIKRLMQRVLGAEEEKRAVVAKPSTAPTPLTACECGPKWASLDRSLEELRRSVAAGKTSHKHFVTSEELNTRLEALHQQTVGSVQGRQCEIESRLEAILHDGQAAPPSRWDHAKGAAEGLGRAAASRWLYTGLGVSGPVGVGLVVGAWLLKRRGGREAVAEGGFRP
ncbi:S1 family peptidase [Pseudobythopirellula maris]|nr:serine protease [Pseudobythopirellula maris]